jgi:hypothetical protein
VLVDKLSIIQNELAILGDNVPATADDGSPEWNVCSPEYEAAIQETIQLHDWNFDSNTATLVQSATKSPDDLYANAMAMPNACLQIIWVRLQESPGADFPADYKIIDNLICLNLDGYSAIAKYMVDPQTAGTGMWPPLFTRIIRHRVRSAIYRGLHEDPEQADKEEAKVEVLLQQARTRVDQQQPKRATFNSRAITARIVRRPFVRLPFSWGGTGTPN